MSDETLVRVMFTGPIGEARFQGFVFPLNKPVAVPMDVAEKLRDNPAFERLPDKPPKKRAQAHT